MNSISESPTQSETTFINCSMWRRLATIFYDTLLLCCVVFLAWQPVPLLPDSIHPALGRGLRLGYLLAICFLFFGWFWTHGGQTLGMRAWRVKLINVGMKNSDEVSWSDAWIRYISAMLSWIVLGSGFIHAIFNKDKSSWHDLLSETKLIVVEKPS